MVLKPCGKSFFWKLLHFNQTTNTKSARNKKGRELRPCPSFCLFLTFFSWVDNLIFWPNSSKKTNSIFLPASKKTKWRGQSKLRAGQLVFRHLSPLSYQHIYALFLLDVDWEKVLLFLIIYLKGERRLERLLQAFKGGEGRMPWNTFQNRIVQPL